MKRTLAAAGLLILTCAPARIELTRAGLELRRTSAAPHSMNVTTDLGDSAVVAICAHFRTQLQADVFGVWTVPGMPDRHLVFAEGPARTKDSYGPQLFVIRRTAEAIEILAATAQQMDADYFDPAFFIGPQRVLMLADYGSEDSWGLYAIDIRNDTATDLHAIDVTRPATLEFEQSALPFARVFVDGDRYVLTFTDAATVYVQSGDRFALAPSPE